MERFKITHPDFEGYRSTNFYVNQVPETVIDGILGLIHDHCNRSHRSLIGVIDSILAVIPESPTTNRNSPWIDADLSRALRTLANMRFDKFMDGLSRAVDALGDGFTEDLNDHLATHYVGYEVKDGSWNLKDESAATLSSEIHQTREVIVDDFKVAADHLLQARDQIKKGDERSIKDAVRDTLSAVESLHKSLTGIDDIRAARKALGDTGNYGKDIIVNDGLMIWKTIHSLHPDVRHGTQDSFDMSEAEAHYWINRLLAWIRYMSSQPKITPV